MPLGNDKASTRFRCLESGSWSNRARPVPSTNGWTNRRYSSIRSAAARALANRPPPHTITSGPASALIVAISVARSPRATCVTGQVASASPSVLENTTFGMSFIGAAYGSSDCGQYDDISWYVTRPMRWAPALLMRSSFHCFSSAPSGTATPGCSRSLPTNPSSDIDMYRMTSRMNASRCSCWFSLLCVGSLVVLADVRQRLVVEQGPGPAAPFHPRIEVGMASAVGLEDAVDGHLDVGLQVHGGDSLCLSL